jgi:hypothetical protein
MANKQTLLRKAKNILDSRLNNTWLHNVYVLYFIFIIALGYAYYLMISSDWYYLTVLVIIGYLTTFFSRNIIVILCIALATTNILKFGIKATMEGFDSEDDEKKEGISSEKTPKKTNETNSYKNEKAVKLIDANKKHSLEDDEEDLTTAYKNPTEESKKKDGFKQKRDGVYTEIDDMDLNEVYAEKDKILKNQEQIMKNLNQYKPLLDTINSISQSVSTMKQMKNSSN